MANLSSGETRKIAFGSLMVESNPRCPLATRQEFEANGYFVGEVLATDLAQPHPRAPAELSGFVDEFTRLEPEYDLVPLISGNGEAAGAIDQPFLDEMVMEICDRISAALPIHGVYLALHGAAIGTEDQDPEATLLQHVRQVVGPDVPIVVTLDLHANVSPAMADLTDALIVYRTNPHIDMAARGKEAAQLVSRITRGMAVKSAFVKLPLIAPTQTHLTDAPPVRDVMAYGQSLSRPPILNVSIATGFSMADSPRAGMAVAVTADNNETEARRVADAVARKLWDERDSFVLDLITIERAVDIALEVSRDKEKPAAIFADPSDNPGAGAHGNTIWILAAFHKARIENCVVGGLVDPALAAEAHRLGDGAKFRAVFNRGDMDPLSGQFEAEAVVECLHAGDCVGRRGIMAGRSLKLGPSCLLRLDGIQVLVISARLQCYDPIFFEMVGVDLATVRCVVVKSRGHFRAGFDEFVGPEQVYDVDAPGLAPQRLDAFPFNKIPRPMYPLDPETTWSKADRFLAS